MEKRWPVAGFLFRFLRRAFGGRVLAVASVMQTMDILFIIHSQFYHSVYLRRLCLPECPGCVWTVATRMDQPFTGFARPSVGSGESSLAGALGLGERKKWKRDLLDHPINEGSSTDFSIGDNRDRLTLDLRI